MGNTVKLNCKFCNGTGRNFTSVCPGCTGYGEVMVVNPPQDCRRCHGTGREFTDPCSICGGCGYMFRQQQQGNMMGGFGASTQVQCKQCHGGGRCFTDNCAGCSGRGIVFVASPPS